REEYAHCDVLRQIFELAHVDLLIPAQAVRLGPLRIRHAVRYQNDVERREHEILTCDERRCPGEEGIEIRESVVRRILLAEIRRDLRHAHVLEGLDRLEGLERAADRGVSPQAVSVRSEEHT